MSQRTCLLRGPHANPDSISASWRRPSLILSISFNWCTYLKAEGMEETFFRNVYTCYIDTWWGPIDSGARGGRPSGPPSGPGLEPNGGPATRATQAMALVTAQ